MGKFIGIFILCGMMVGFSAAQYRLPKTVDLIEDKEPPRIFFAEPRWEKKRKAPRIPINDVQSLPPLMPSSGVAPQLGNPIPRGGLPAVYEYQVSVKNEGGKKIQAINWEYIFSDSESGQELKRHNFFSFRTIGKGGNSVIEVRSSAPPTDLVTLESLKKDQRSQYIERVEARCVVYTDSSFWVRGDVPPEECKANYNENRRYRRWRKLF